MLFLFRLLESRPVNGLVNGGEAPARPEMTR
jgi:hypothetical protein